MAAPAEQEPKEILSRSPDGTFEFLESYDGFRVGRSFFPEPEDKGEGVSLSIRHEDDCQKADNCMVFLLKIDEVSGDTLTCTQIGGHITDKNEIVDLDKNTYVSVNGEYSGGDIIPVDIDAAMKEVRAAIEKLTK